jgi:hypothetical protein
LVDWNIDSVWKLLNLNIISATISIKSLLLEDFGSRVHNEGLQNGYEDLLVTSMDR